MTAALPVTDAAIWTICAAAVGGVLFRPRGIGEWVWALGGATLLALLGFVTPREALAAVRRGTDVYLFLGGMMMVSELARGEGVFDWVAGRAVRAAGGSRVRLFSLVYAVGVLVTTVLSNDATAVVMTPAVAAAVKRANAPALPHVMACAFIANAASFVLPISNPANLVIFGAQLPTLGAWLAIFALPSAFAIGATFLLLRLVTRGDLRGAISRDVEVPELTLNGRITLAGIGFMALVLIVCSTLGIGLGAPTLAAAAIAYAAIAVRDCDAALRGARGTSWTVLLLVAGLFVLVAGAEQTGLLDTTRHALQVAAAWPLALGVLATGGTTGLVSNAINNLPAGLIAGTSLSALHGHDALRGAVAIGIDLGPNLSVTGSLATVLWLIALRREQIDVSAWSFLRVGAVVMPPALVLALESLALTGR